jgi:hypothetical protein
MLELRAPPNAVVDYPEELTELQRLPALTRTLERLANELGT